MSNEEKVANIDYAAMTNGEHCAICMNINGCYFPINNSPGKFFSNRLHINCHCRNKIIYDFHAEAECNIEKFRNYIFLSKEKNDKSNLFKSWGYSKEDSEYLQGEFERQAKTKYRQGEFRLGKLNAFGQRISIEIVLNRKDKLGTISFESVWMVYPYGKIKIITPYGGK